MMALGIYYVSLSLTLSLSAAQYGTTSKTPRIYSLHIHSDIKYRFSTTLVTSKVANPDTVSREAKFDVTLPNEAFITKFKLTMNNKTYDGEVKEKEEAKAEYKKAKARGQSAGHIVAKPRETNKFNIMVNVAAQEKVTFELTYQELLHRKKGQYSHVIYIDPRDVVQDLLVEVTITESRDLTMVQVPAIRNDTLSSTTTKSINELAIVERPSPRNAKIVYRPTIDQQRQESQSGIRGQFVVEYDINRDNKAGELLVVNGYFVHYFAPDNLPPLPMDILFILDKSGSMKGRKIMQLKEAMKKILSDMRSDDRFTIMTFDGRIRLWEDQLVPVNDQTLSEANRYVSTTRASGSTNINDALKRGINLLSTTSEASRVPVIIFLTDGKPTVGETVPENILLNIRSKNDIKVPIFSLAFGGGADYSFTKKLAAQNNGLGRKIYEDSDSSLQITGFIEEISTVLLKNVKFEYLDGDVNETTLTETSFKTVFGGGEVIVCGRLAEQPIDSLSNNELPVTITGSGINGSTVSLVLPDPIIIEKDKTMNLTQSGDFSKIIEKLWAYLTIKQMVRRKDSISDRMLKKEMDNKIINLSLKYQFVTSLTSMVVVLPDNLTATPPLVDDDAVIQPVFFLKSTSGRKANVGVSVSTSYTAHWPVAHSDPGVQLSRTKLRRKHRKKKVQKYKRRRKQKKRRKVISINRKFVSLLVKIPGLTWPLCMNPSTKPGNVTLFSRPGKDEVILETGPSRRHLSPVVRVFYSNQTSSQDYTSIPAQGDGALLLQIDNSDLNISVSQSSYKSRDMRLQIYASVPVTNSKSMAGILGLFSGYNGRLVKERKKKGKTFAKIRIRKKSKTYRLRAVQVNRPYPKVDLCWLLNRGSMRKLIVGP